MDSKFVLTIFFLCSLYDVAVGSSSAMNSSGCLCSPSGRCRYDEECELRSNCRTRNVAFGVPKQKIVSAQKKMINTNASTCVSNATIRYASMLKVNLGQNYPIYHMTVYYRNKAQILRPCITVDGQKCFIPSPAVVSLRDRFELQCYKPVIGSIVKVFQPFKQEICDIKIWVCKRGLYGKRCDRKCSGHCKNSLPCDNFHGTCPEGCIVGYYGRDCSRTCGHCRNSNTCNENSGNCPTGCKIGWVGQQCTKECRTGTIDTDCQDTSKKCQLPFCLHANGSCLTECSREMRERTIPATNTETNQGNTSTVLIVCGVIGLLTIMTIAVSVTVWRRRKTAHQKTKEDQFPLQIQSVTDGIGHDALAATEYVRSFSSNVSEGHQPSYKSLHIYVGNEMYMYAMPVYRERQQEDDVSVDTDSYISLPSQTYNYYENVVHM